MNHGPMRTRDTRISNVLHLILYQPWLTLIGIGKDHYNALEAGNNRVVSFEQLRALIIVATITTDQFLNVIYRTHSRRTLIIIYL